MSSGASKSARPARPSGRSTSPRAVERRRLQNRISQRNRRQRMKELSSGSLLQDPSQVQGDGDATAEPDPQKALASSHSPHLQWAMSVGVDEMNNYIDFQNLAPPNSNPWPCQNVDSTINFDAAVQSSSSSSPPLDAAIDLAIAVSNDGPIAHPSFAVSHCKCNPATGPCPGHMEQIRAQVLAGRTSALPVQQQNPIQQAPDVDLLPRSAPLTTPGAPYSFPEPGEPQHQPLFVQGSGETTSENQNRPPPKDSSPVASRTIPAPPPTRSTSSSTAEKPKSTRHNSDSHDITARFEGILDAMRTAGFQDFDQMAVSYYTAQFDMNSLPAIAQRASRSRRLKSVLRDVQQCSAQWPRRESRGLNEGLVETATTLCVEEIGRVDKTKPPNLDHIDPGILLFTLGCLFFSREDEMDTSSDGAEGSNIPEEVKKLAEQMEVAQDSMLHLWPFLTELAGPQGLYCDKIAQVALAVLLYARQVHDGICREGSFKRQSTMV